MEELVIAEGIKQAIKYVFDTGKEKLKNTDLEISYSEEELHKSIIFHIQSVKNWAESVSFNDSKGPKRTSEIYIELDIFLYPKRVKISEEEKIETIPLRKVFHHTNKHILLLGQPGAGKTTSMKTLCNYVLFDDTFYPGDFTVPLLIRFREFNLLSRGKTNNSLIFRRLSEMLNLKVEVKNADSYDTEYIDNIKERFILDILNQINALIILDGFDELVYRKDKDIVLAEIGKLFNFIESSRIVLTSRSSDFNYSFENAFRFEIAPLNQAQIVDFANKWLGSEESSKVFIAQMKRSPFQDTSVKPLNLAHLCAIFERVGKIPDKPKTVYKKIISLLLEEWDEQRQINRISSYGNFEVDRKFEFLSNLAFYLTTTHNKTVFTKEDLKKAYLEIHQDFDLRKEEIKEVVNELESHTGLLIQSNRVIANLNLLINLFKSI